MNNWNYGGAYLQYPIETGIAIVDGKSYLKTHDIFEPLPSFMLQADLLFVDPPWNKGNMKTFYTKAEKMSPQIDFSDFYKRLFACINKINPNICYVEIGKEYLAEFIIEMKKLYRYVTFYNSSYYHTQNNICYVIRGANTTAKPKLDYMDEENIIKWICENEPYHVIGDLCMGRGLVAVNAYKHNKAFVGTELNHKRLSVALERLCAIGAEYTINNYKTDNCEVENMGKKVPIAVYAKLHNKSVDTIRARCIRGAFNTAEKITERCWVIDKNEPYIDHRQNRPSVLKEKNKKIKKN